MCIRKLCIKKDCGICNLSSSPHQPLRASSACTWAPDRGLGQWAVLNLAVKGLGGSIHPLSVLPDLHQQSSPPAWRHPAAAVCGGILDQNNLHLDGLLNCHVRANATNLLCHLCYGDSGVFDCMARFSRAQLGGSFLPSESLPRLHQSITTGGENHWGLQVTQWQGQLTEAKGETVRKLQW